ncbi:hypothetical protein DRW03_18455 [Corallococcus sp. H22C18031201]|nr:hypothetical protein DRW03_18455 [Corallococcus sp. H22C18031201]
MKVDGPDAPSRESPANSERFRDVLQRADPRRPPPASRAPSPPGDASMRGPKKPGNAPARALGPSTVRPSGALVATQRSAFSLGSTTALGQARQSMHVEAHRLSTVRGEAHAMGQQRNDQRASELIEKELRRTHPEPSAIRSPSTRPDGDGSAPSSLAPVRPPPSDNPVQAAGGAPPPQSGAIIEAPTRAEAALALIERIEVLVKAQRPALSLSLRGAMEATVEVQRTGPREIALHIQGRQRPLAGEDLSRLTSALEARGLRLRTVRSE